MKTASIDINRKENRKSILSISHILLEVSNNVNTCIQQTIRFSEKMNFATKSFTPYAQTVNRYCMTLKGKNTIIAQPFSYHQLDANLKRIKNEIKSNLLPIAFIVGKGEANY